MVSLVNADFYFNTSWCKCKQFYLPRRRWQVLKFPHEFAFCFLTCFLGVFSIGRYKKTDMRIDSDDDDLMDEEYGRICFKLLSCLCLYPKLILRCWIIFWTGRNQPSADGDKGVANTLQYHPYTDDPQPNEATAPYRDNPDTHEAEDRYTDHPASTQYARVCSGCFAP